MTVLSKVCVALVFGQAALGAPRDYYTKSSDSTELTYPPQTTTEQTYPPQTTTEQTYPPQTTTEQTYPPQTTTKRTYPPHTTTERTYPPHTTTKATYPPHTTTEATYPPHTTTEATYPPHTTTEATYPPHTTTKATYPPHTTTEATYPPHTTTKATYPPHTTTKATYPPHTTTKATYPPHTTTEQTYPPHTTTKATYPPHTTTEQTYPPHTTTELTYPPQTTTEQTYPPHTTTEQTYPPHTTTEQTYPPQTTTEATYPAVTNPPQQTGAPVDPSCPQMDGNHEVMLPPLLDEDMTRVVFGHGSENMQVRLLVPKQYSSLKVDFEGADDDSAAVDVDLANPSSEFWDFDFESDPCNVVVTSSIPWNQFRSSLGGISERRYPSSVWYGTQINIATTFDFELKPETLLLAEGEGDNPHHIQYFTRTVKNVIPFDIHFDKDLNLWSQINVRSPYLRKATALLEASVLEVNPDQSPMASGRLEFASVIPSPLYLHTADIRVNDPLLADGLTIEEIVEKRDCDNVNVEAFCTQHWRVNVAPEKCDLNGQYTATMYGACNPESNNCIQPSPNTMDVVLDIVSDDYCGVSQQVDLVGSLNLHPTQCNEYMKGSIVTSSPQGAAISKVEILKLETTPTLEGQEFLTVFDAARGTNELNFATSQSAPNQLDFQFEWVGKQLRCDVIAQVDAMVRVEFAATEPLLLSASSNGRSTRMSLLESEDMRVAERVHIAADPAQIEEVEETDAPLAADADEDSAAATATSSIAAVFGVFSALWALL